MPDEERDFPIDDSVGACGDAVVKLGTGLPYPWTREHPAIDIVGARPHRCSVRLSDAPIRQPPTWTELVIQHSE